MVLHSGMVYSGYRIRGLYQGPAVLTTESRWSKEETSDVGTSAFPAVLVFEGKWGERMHIRFWNHAGIAEWMRSSLQVKK